MPFYLYITPTGLPDITEHPLELSIFPGYTYVGEYEQRPQLHDKKYNFSTQQWEDSSPFPLYVRNRKAEYPTIGDQLDALWHAMDQGTLPKIQPMYAQIKAVKDKYPKPSNNG